MTVLIVTLLLSLALALWYLVIQHVDPSLDIRCWCDTIADTHSFLLCNLNPYASINRTGATCGRSFAIRQFVKVHSTASTIFFFPRSFSSLSLSLSRPLCFYSVTIVAPTIRSVKQTYERLTNMMLFLQYMSELAIVIPAPKNPFCINDLLYSGDEIVLRVIKFFIEFYEIFISAYALKMHYLFITQFHLSWRNEVFLVYKKQKLLTRNFHTQAASDISFDRTILLLTFFCCFTCLFSLIFLLFIPFSALRWCHSLVGLHFRFVIYFT